MFKKDYTILPEPTELVSSIFTDVTDPYKRVYSYYLADVKDEELNVLEIGSREGTNLISLSNWFTNSKIFGIEKNLELVKSYNESIEKNEEFQNIRIFFEDSTVNYSWVLMDEKFDVIIDNGSSKPENQIKTMRRGWSYLVSEGLYIIQNSSSAYTNPSIESLAAEIYLMERANAIKECVSYFYKKDNDIEYITVIKKNKLRKK